MPGEDQTLHFERTVADCIRLAAPRGGKPLQMYTQTDAGVFGCLPIDNLVTAMTPFERGRRPNWSRSAEVRHAAGGRERDLDQGGSGDADGRAAPPLLDACLPH